MILKEDLIKIEEFLKKRSVCDCDLELRDFITGDELIPIICKEGNMNLPINRLESYFKKDFFILNKLQNFTTMKLNTIPIRYSTLKILNFSTITVWKNSHLML